MGENVYDKRVKDIMSRMLRNGVHHLPVLDQHERLLGIVSTMDILAEFADGAPD